MFTARGIDDKNGVFGRVRRTPGLSDDDRGVGRGQVIDDASKGLEPTAEAASIWGRRQMLQRRDDRTEKLATTTEASAEEDEPGVLTTTMYASVEEAEETKCMSERLQCQRRHCVYRLRVLTTTTALSEQ